MGVIEVEIIRMTSNVTTMKNVTRKHEIVELHIDQ